MGDTSLTSHGNLSIGGNVAGRDINTTNIHEAPAPLALNLHQIPPPPRDFTGRDAELTELLANFEKGIAISGLHGQGGIGKTALAFKLAEQLLPRYPDAQFYLDLKGASEQKPLTPAEALSHVIRAYHPTSTLPEDEAQLRALYQSVLHNQRALLLMDNAKDAAQVESLLPPATCCLLITSRQHFHLPGIHTKNLDALPPDDARSLLLTIAPRISPSPIGPSTAASTSSASAQDAPTREGCGVADELAQLCGYLPLALRVTASALAERIDLSPTDYIRRLSDAQQRLKLTGVDASLQLSYDLLTPELQKLWRILSVFPETFDRAAAMAVWSMEEDPAQDALSELVKFSLLDYSPHSLPDFSPHPGPLPSGERESPPSPRGSGDGGEGELSGRYHLHDLARLYADSRLPEPERYEVQRCHAAYYETVLRKANRLYKQGSESLKYGLNLFELEWKNIQTGQKWAYINTEKDNVSAKLCSNYLDAGVYLLLLRRHPREQVHWLTGGTRALAQLKDFKAAPHHLFNLGNAFATYAAWDIAIREPDSIRESRLRNFLAISFYEKSLASAHKISDLQSEGNALNGLGKVYITIGKTSKAVECLEKSLKILREISDRHGEGNVLGNFGLVYYNLGETRKAIKFHEQCLTIAREVSDRRGEGNALGNLGLAYNDLGEHHKAIEFYEQQFTINREIGDWLGESNSLWNMSLALDKLGERAQAIARAEAALKILEEIESPYAEYVRKQLEAWRG